MLKLQYSGGVPMNDYQFCRTTNLNLGAKIGLTLSKEHHNTHHQYDNTHYAFLNGCTNPFLNYIAKKYFGGYKNNTDSHYREYDLMGTR